MLLGYFLPFSDWENCNVGHLPGQLVSDLEDSFVMLTAQVARSSGTLDEAAYRSLLKEQYEALPAHLRDLVKFDYFIQQAERKKEDIVAQYHELQN